MLKSGRFMPDRAPLLMRGALIAVGLVFLASCSSSGPATKFSEAEYGVKASPRVASGKSVPKGGGREMVGKPYRVAGKTYVPQDDPDYKATGLASWYGPNFHGRKTANGEVFDMNDLTAAHPTLPLPSYVRVTNLSNNRSVVVRVNDRGPFSRNRVIDVSATTAALLDFKRAGVAKVQVEYVGRAEMDGRDRDMLMATYQGPPGTAPTKSRSLFASRKPTRHLTIAQQPIVVAATPRTEPLAVVPTEVSTGFNDQIGPLILKSGFVNSYAETNRFTPAHAAAAELAAESTPARLSTFTKRDAARTLLAATTIQLGVFLDQRNAARVGDDFARFGEVVTTDQARDGRTLRIVQVVIRDTAIAPEAVIKAASAAGLSGAFVVSR
ncbi:septal ring lytic transglycosylase RlpA family protein [Bauldia litoralis]|uniref:Endolytic peptidoglycan transglycosylase RlpA n=1 Tax=Bauldia litoralis TaxID=665467 RepID=A0A1G6B035_9HYPH|nr:septal ring lytic transglycosylase RlpA family protein [Bauldia litoralis]SDB13849.1 Rare lipoprotein A (RlpA)-like double-psi beta-barrel [Bauldia litoralis]